ncbi:MAG: lipoyl(octanoyl) transferase LipB [Chloroflexota bacterium]
MVDNICKAYRLGVVEYMKGWHLQQQMSQMVADGEHPPTLILMEHSHVYTFGKSASEDNLLWNADQLKEKLVDSHWIDRGGDVTYHGPGQLVGYPILPISQQQPSAPSDSIAEATSKIDLSGYLRNLEKVIIKTLADFGIISGQIDGQTGVWIQPDMLSKCVHCPPDLYKAPAKIASIGVKVNARGISSHGFALNVDTDMSYFDGILACGLENQNKAKLAYFMNELPSMNKIVQKVVSNFGKVFDYEMQLEPGVILL